MPDRPMLYNNSFTPADFAYQFWTQDGPVGVPTVVYENAELFPFELRDLMTFMSGMGHAIRATRDDGQVHIYARRHDRTPLFTLIYNPDGTMTYMEGPYQCAPRPWPR